MSNSLTADIINLLKPGPGLILILTVGNTLRSDDGVGPYIASQLNNTKNLKIINCGYMPENFIDDAASLSPQRVVFIDAADFGIEPGGCRLVDEEHIPQASLSTHNVSLRVISAILKADTGADIKFLGIQPESVDFKEGLSDRVKEAADKVIKAIRENFKDA